MAESVKLTDPNTGSTVSVPRRFAETLRNAGYTEVKASVKKTSSSKSEK